MAALAAPAEGRAQSAVPGSSGPIEAAATSELSTGTTAAREAGRGGPETSSATAAAGSASSAEAVVEKAEARAAAEATLALRADLDRWVRAPSWGDSEWGVLVVSLDAGDTLYAVNADRPLAPASNAKLLTTAAALHALGPEYRFRTYVISDGTVTDGVLHGDLVLYGTGDPGISARFYRDRDEVFHRLIDQLEALGIREITGDLIADASFLAGPLRPAGWDPRDLNDHFTAPVSALSYNENVVSFRIAPATRAGDPPEVHTIPRDAGLSVLNFAETVPGAARPRVAILREDPLEPVRIEGEITLGARDVWRQLTVSRPAHFTASVFRAALARRGISVAGEVTEVELPSQSIVSPLSAPFAGRRGPRILARHESEPLQRYLEVINKQSHNLFAELVFRAVARARTGIGTEAAGAAAVKAVLEELGVDATGIALADGSGLSASNRVSAETLVALLDRMAAGPLWNHYWQSLPEAGRSRELGRMYRTAAAGNLRAKTGTIEGVSALTGVVRASDGERLAFSILLNRTRSTVRAKAVENQIGARLASLERGITSPDTPAMAATMAAAAALSDPRHRVATGENLSTIALRYDVSVDDILSANPRVDANRIRAGEWIVIPRPPPELRTRAGG